MATNQAGGASPLDAAEAEILKQFPANDIPPDEAAILAQFDEPTPAAPAPELPLMTKAALLLNDTIPRAVMDFGAAVDQSIVSTPGAVAGIGDVALNALAASSLAQGGNPDAWGEVAKAGNTLAPALASTGYNPKVANAELELQKTQGMQDIGKEGQATKGFMNTLSFAAKHPTYALDAVGQSIGPMAVGGIASRGFTALGANPLIAAGLGEGGMSAGSTTQAISDGQGGAALTPAQSALVLASGMGVAGMGVVGAKLSQYLGVADIDSLMAGATSEAVKKDIWQKALTVAIATGIEGGVEEMPQSAIETIAQNLAQGKQWSSGVPESMAMGLVAGGIMGGGTELHQVTGSPRGEAEVLTEHELDKVNMQSKVDASEAIAALPDEAQVPLKQAAEEQANAEAMAGVDAILASLDIAPLSEQDKAEAVAEAEAEKAAAVAKADELKHPDLKDGEQADSALSLYRQNTREGEENANDTTVVPLMKQRVTNSADPTQLGKTLARTKLTPGIAVGVSADEGTSDLFPAKYRQAAVDTTTWMMQKLKLGHVKVVLKFEALSGDSTASVDVHKNGTYVINPSHLTRFGDSSQYSQIAQVQAGGSLAHEVGHIFTLEELQKGMTSQHREEFDSLPDNALLSEGLIAAQTPEVQGILLEYNAMKARVLDGSMGAQEFVDTWLGPSKSGRGMNTKDGRQTFAQDMLGKFRGAKNATAKQVADAMGGNILSAHEYLAEQMARYAHDRKLLEQAPLGTQQFFGRALAALREFFASLKKEGIIKAGTSFTAYVDGITGVGKAKVSRPRKSKAKSAPIPADAPAPAVLKVKKAKAPKVVQQLPAAFRPLSIIAAEVKADKMSKVADALMGVDKLEVTSARANALKVIKANTMLQKVKEEDPEAYKEMLGYANAGQFESFREMAEDYIGFKAAQKLTFNNTDPIEGRAPDWTWAAIDFLEAKAPTQNTLAEWYKLFEAWSNPKRKGGALIKPADYQFSGMRDYLKGELATNGSSYKTKEEIITKMQSAAGPFELVVLSGRDALHNISRPDEFLADGEYTNIENYHELVFVAPASMPPTSANKHFRQPVVTSKGQGTMRVRGEFTTDFLGRKEFHVHEIQSDIRQALAAYKNVFATSAKKTGKTRTVVDAEGNALAVYPKQGAEYRASDEIQVDLHNIETVKLNTYEKQGSASHKTDVWLGQALRSVMRFAADNNASIITFATAEQQLNTYPTDTITFTGNALSIKTGTGEVVSGAVASIDDVNELLIVAGYSPTDVAKHSAKIAANPQGIQLTPRKAGMSSFYGVGETLGSGIIHSTLKKQNLWANTDTKGLEFTADGRGVYVKQSWAGKPVSFFNTDPSKGTGPAFEEMTRELARTGLAGEMQNAGRKMAAFGSRMANAVVTIQQLAFANKYIAGLNYYKDQTIAFQSYKASLEISAVSIAHEWSKLGKEQFAKMANLLEAEYAEGVHYATLQKNPQTKKWEMVASPRFVEEAKKHGVDEQTAALALRIKQSILARQNSLENTLFTQALLRFGPQSKRAKVAIAEIMKTMDAIRSQPYLPQSRFGDFGAMVYEVTFDSAGKEVKILKHKEFFQTEGARDDAVRKLQKAVGTGHLVTAYNYRAGMSRFGGVPAGVLSTIAAELELTEEQQNQVLSMLDTAKESKALRQYSKKLAGVTGRNKDLLRNYADYMQADANVQAKMRFGSEFKRALTSVANDIAILDAAQVKGPEYAAQRRKMESILQYMESHKDYMMNPQNEMSSIKTVVVLWQLWGVIKTAVANLTALVAVLADAQAHFGNIKGTAAVGKAGFDTVAVGMNSVLKNAKQLLKVSGSESKVLNAEDDWAITKAQVEGILDQTFAAQLGDFSEAGVLQRLGGSQVNNMWQHTKRMGLVPLHMIEVSTRYTAMLTKFRLYRAAGLDVNEAYKNAAEETRLIMGDSTRINRPPFMRGKAANFTIYYGFTQLMMYLFSGAYERGYSERAIELNAKGYQITPRKNALGGMTTRMWLMFLLLGGAEGLPGEADIRAIIRMIAQKMFGTDYDLDLEMRKWVMDFNTHIDDLGIQLDPSTVLHGITHNIGGFDLSGSVGFGRIIPGLATLGDSGATGVDTALAGAGPLGGFVSGMVRALTGGQPTLSLQVAPAMPTIVKNQIEVYNWAKDGVRFHSGGKVVRDLETGELRNLETGELIGKSLGFNPTAVVEAREMHFMQKDAAMFWAEKHSVVMGNVAEAVLQNDREAIADSLRALTKFNANAPSAMRINQGTLMKSIKMSAKKAAYDTAGVPMQKAQQAIAAEVKSTFPRAN